MMDEDKYKGLDFGKVEKQDAPKDDKFAGLDFGLGLKKKESSESSGQSGTSASQTTSPNNPNGLSLPDIGKVVSEYKEHPLPLSPDQIQQKYITDAEKENDVTKLQQQAYQHATTKNYAASNAIADIIQQKDPKNAYANTLKGNNLLHDGKPALAENEFTQALKKNPTDPDLYYDRAIANMQVNGKPTPQSITDAKTYETAQGGVANGDETVAKKLSHTYAIQGDNDKADYWRKNAEFIKADKEKRKEGAAIASFPDYFIATSPVTAPMVGMQAGIEKMVEGVAPLLTNEGVEPPSLAKTVSGAMETTFGAMGYVNPELLLFNMGTAQAQYTAPSQVTEALTAPITTAYIKSGGNPENLNEWGKLGLQTFDLATFGLFFGLMKKGEGKIGEKLFRNEPLTPDETATATQVSADMTKADVDNTLQQGKQFVEAQKNAQQVSEVQQAHPDIQTYRVGGELVDKDALLKQAQDVKNYYGEDVPVPKQAQDLFETTDPEVNKQLNELFKKEVQDASKIQSADEMDGNKQAGTTPQVAKGKEAQLQEPAGKGEEKEGVKFWHEEKNLPDNLKERLDVGEKATPEQTAEIDKTKELLRTEPDGTKVYAVDGNLVRSTVHPDFAMGGNDMAYPNFVPKNEVWVEKDLIGDARETTITHELTERKSMQDGKPYVSEDEKSGAHVDALKAEQGEPTSGIKTTETGETVPEKVQKKKPTKPVSEAKKRGAEQEKKIAERAKQIADNIRKGKLSRPDIFSTATPASLVWDGALEIAARTVELGGDVGQAIADAIKHVKGSDWYKALSDQDKQIAEQAVSDEITNRHRPEEEPKGLSTESTGVNRAIIDNERVNKGLDEVDKSAKGVDKENYERAKQDIMDGTVKVSDVMDRLNKENRPATGYEVNVLKVGKMRNIKNHHNVYIQYEQAEAEGNELAKEVEMNKLLALEAEKEEINATAGKYASRQFYELGKALQGFINDDYSISSILSKAKILGGGKEVPEIVKSKLRKATSDFLKAQEDYETKVEEKSQKTKTTIVGKSDTALEKAVKRAIETQKRTTKLEKTIAEKKAELSDLDNAFRKQMAQAGSFPNPEAAVTAAKIIYKNIEIGGLKLAEAIDKFHNDFKDLLAGVSKDDIKKAIRDYTEDLINQEEKKANTEPDGTPKKTKTELEWLADDLKKQKKTLQRINDIESGKIKPKTESDKVKQSLELKDLKRKLSQVERQHGFHKMSNEAKLQSRKTYYKNKIDEYEQKLKNKDFAPKPKPEPVMDDELRRLQYRASRAKDKVDMEMSKWVYKNSPTYTKILNGINDFGRAMKLTSTRVFGKLTNAAVFRAVQIPVEKLVAQGYSKLPYMSKIAKEAPLYGQGSLDDIATLYTNIFSKKSALEAWNKLQTGKSRLDIDKKVKYHPQTLLNYIYYSHGFFKEPIRQGAYEMAMHSLTKYALTKGMDLNDPFVLTTLDAKAKNYANEQILQKDNRFVNWWKRSVIGGLERLGVGGNVAGALLKSETPIINVPANFFMEQTSYNIGFFTGATKVAQVGFRDFMAKLKGNEYKIDPKDAEFIYKNLSKGTIGLVCMAVGYLDPENFGGYYDPQNKTKDEDMARTGHMKFFGWEVPTWASHLPFLSPFHIGATIRHIHDYYLEQGDEDSGLEEAGHVAKTIGYGIAEESPILGQQMRSINELMSQRNPGKFAGEWVRGMFEPYIAIEAAERADQEDGNFNWNPFTQGKPRPVDIKTFWDVLQSGTPGARNQMPDK